MKTVVHSSSEIVRNVFAALQIPYDNCSSLTINIVAGKLVTIDATFIMAEGPLKSFAAVLEKEQITAKIENT